MRACARCGKSFTMGGTRKLLRGKHNPTRWTQKKANLQWTRAFIPGKRMLLCTRCLRTITRNPAKKTAEKK